MNKYDLEKAIALDDKITITKNFKDALLKFKNHHVSRGDKYVNIDISGYNYKLSSVTYDKLIDVLDKEIKRYGIQFSNFLAPSTTSEDTINMLKNTLENYEKEFNSLDETEELVGRHKFLSGKISGIKEAIAALEMV